jgi:hypothetical protein
MSERTRALLDKHVANGTPYHWDLDAATFEIGGATLRLVVVGTVAEDSFLWAWANESIPLPARSESERVRQFGVEHDLGLLIEPCAPGGLAQGKECVAVAGRILDADAAWIERTGEEDSFILFVLFE